MKTFDLASKYAKALINVTPSVEVLEKHRDQINEIIHLLEKPYLKNFLASPQIGKEKKAAVLKEVLEKKVDSEILAFLLLLLEKKRLKYLPDIVKQYSELVKEKEGILKARLLTAVPLDENTQAILKDKLSSMYHKKIEIENSTDPSLIGGGIIFIGKQMLDFSLKGKLNKLKQDLLGYHQ